MPRRRTPVFRCSALATLTSVAVDPTDVPLALRALIPLAEQWGIGDDIDRTSAVKGADPEELKMLVTAVDSTPSDAWEKWLTGPESFSSSPTDAYLAFTCLLMACDQARLDLARRNP